MVNRRVVRARAFLVCSFTLAALFQIYAFYTQSGPPDYAVYAPNPYFLMIFFAMQAGLQIYWIVQMFRYKARESTPALLSPIDEGFRPDMDADHTSTAPEPAQMAYIPTYSLGNLCIVGSVVSWEFEHLIISQLFMTCNAACQLYFVLFTLNSSGKYGLTRKNRFTHLVAKTSAGVAVLHTWKAWGVLELGSSRPTIQQQVHCGVLFLLLVFASGPDPTLGICLLFDLAALAAGNTKEEWKFAFICIMGVLFVVIAFDCMLAWKNRNAPNEFSHLEEEEMAFHDSDAIWMSDLAQDSERV